MTTAREFMASSWRFSARHHRAGLVLLSLVLNSLVTLQCVRFNMRLAMLEKQLRITRVRTEEFGVVCSVDGLNWYPARDDGMCYAEDAPISKAAGPVATDKMMLARAAR